MSNIHQSLSTQDPTATADLSNSAIGNHIPSVRATLVQFRDEGGAVLQGQLLEPQAGQPSGTVLINNATGVPARFYVPFARWLAEAQGKAVLVWDYRDFGASGNPRGSTASLADWGIQDATVARKWLKQRYPELPLWLIGHSLGGLALAFQTDLQQIDRVITVAAGPVHLSDHPWPHRLIVAAMWYVHGPILTKLLGYFPGKRLGLGADIPGPAYWQWRKWCSQRGSVLSDPTAPPLASHNLRAPVTLVAFADDALVPPCAVWRLADWLPASSVERRLIDPKNYGLDRIGHVAAFSPRNRKVWPTMIAEADEICQ